MIALSTLSTCDQASLTVGPITTTWYTHILCKHKEIRGHRQNNSSMTVIIILLLYLWARCCSLPDKKKLTIDFAQMKEHITKDKKIHTITRCIVRWSRGVKYRLSCYHIKSDYNYMRWWWWDHLRQFGSFYSSICSCRPISSLHDLTLYKKKPIILPHITNTLWPLYHK